MKTHGNSNTALRLTRFMVALLITTSLAGCQTLTRLSEVGDPPEMSNIRNSTTEKSYKPVSLPMPAPHLAEDNPNSL